MLRKLSLSCLQTSERSCRYNIVIQGTFQCTARDWRLSNLTQGFRSLPGLGSLSSTPDTRLPFDRTANLGLGGAVRLADLACDASFCDFVKVVSCDCSRNWSLVRRCSATSLTSSLPDLFVERTRNQENINKAISTRNPRALRLLHGRYSRHIHRSKTSQELPTCRTPFTSPVSAPKQARRKSRTSSAFGKHCY